MQTLRFKTNLKCNGCIQAITPGMNEITEISSWKVFLDDPDKILEVNHQNDEKELSEKVINAVSKAGYSIEKV